MQDTVLLLILLGITRIIFHGAILWVGITTVTGSTGVFGTKYGVGKELFIVAVASAILPMIPVFGWILAIIGVFILLYEFTESTFMKVLLIVVVSQLVARLAILVLFPFIFGALLLISS